MLTKDNALIWALRINCWEGIKLNRDLTNQINRSFDADADAGKYHGRVVPAIMLKPVNAAKNQMREAFNDITSPYTVLASRVGGKHRYLDVKGKIIEHGLKFNYEADKFIAEYTKWQNTEAPRKFLGKNYNPRMFPEASRLRQKFSFAWTVVPYNQPPTGDSILDEDLREEYARTQETADKELRADIASRIYDAVHNIYTRLITNQAFRSESFDSLAKQADIIRALNILNDPRVTSLALDAERLGQADRKGIREDESYKQTVATQANAMLSKLNSLRDTPDERHSGTENKTSQDNTSPQPRMVLNGAVLTEVPRINGNQHISD